MDPASTTQAVKTGISLGTVIAAILSWDRNKSFVWIIVHGVLSWFYVIYFIFTDKQYLAARRTFVFVVLAVLALHVLVIICFAVYHLLKT